jgi:hypothetical protein
MAVTFPAGVSWGYYNNMTKQEPPADWSVTAGEDRFFAWRMAEGIGIPVQQPHTRRRTVLSARAGAADNRHRPALLRVASLYPESIEHVDFFRNGALYDSAWDESFMVHFQSNWRQGGVPSVPGDGWRAEIHLRDGRVIERSGVVGVRISGGSVGGMKRET